MKDDHTCAALFKTKDAEVHVIGTNADEVLKVSRELTAGIGASELQQQPILVRSPELSRRVFIVHGHDDASRESVARSLSGLGSRL